MVALKVFARMVTGRVVSTVLILMSVLIVKPMLKIRLVLNASDSYSCQCNTGFASYGDAYVGVDPCLLGTHNCAMQADCISKYDQFTCECKTGFQGNGRRCFDRNECHEN